MKTKELINLLARDNQGDFAVCIDLPYDGKRSFEYDIDEVTIGPAFKTTHIKIRESI